MNGGSLPSGPQLWTKHIFWEKDWVVMSESPPEGSGRRRVGITIKYLAGAHRVAILAFHEAEAGDATPQDVEEAEHQAIEACMGNQKTRSWSSCTPSLLSVRKGEHGSTNVGWITLQPFLVLKASQNGVTTSSFTNPRQGISKQPI